MIEASDKRYRQVQGKNVAAWRSRLVILWLIVQALAPVPQLPCLPACFLSTGRGMFGLNAPSMRCRVGFASARLHVDRLEGKPTFVFRIGWFVSGFSTCLFQVCCCVGGHCTWVSEVRGSRVYEVTLSQWGQTQCLPGDRCNDATTYSAVF